MRDLDIGVVGTARRRIGWPPRELSPSPAAVFNDIRYAVDKHGTLVLSWVDNVHVLMISTVHDPTEKILRARRRPRVTRVSKAHIESAWGGRPTAEIEIPTVIDDYNHIMGGVDMADQRISYFHPNLRCHRTWFPMFLRCPSIVRNNIYVIHSSAAGSKPLRHCDFLKQMVRSLRQRPIDMKCNRQASTRRRSLDTNSTVVTKRKRLRQGKKSPSLPAERLLGDTSDHVHRDDPAKRQRRCAYCAYLCAKFEVSGSNGNPVKIVKPSKICNTCNVHLGSAHFELYHKKISVSYAQLS